MNRNIFKNKWLYIVILLTIAAGVILALLLGTPASGRKNNAERVSSRQEEKASEKTEEENTDTSTPVPTEEVKPVPTEAVDNKPVDEEPAPVEYVEQKVRVNNADASSYLKTKSKDGQTYEPKHVIDGDYTTAWIEGAEELGIGESVTLDFDKTERITRLLIYNGFLNSEYRYEVNGKVTKASVEFDDGTNKEIILKTMETSGQKAPFVEANLNPTELVLDEPITASSVKITILDAEAGSQYSDVCISEVEIFHEVDVNEAKQAIVSVDEDVIDAYTVYFADVFATTEGDAYSVAFMYLDEDDVPELLVREEFDMGSIAVLQYSGSKIYNLGWYQSLSYIPRENKIVDSWSDGETSEMVLYQIKNSTFTPMDGVSTCYEDGGEAYYIIDKSGIRTETSAEEYHNHIDAMLADKIMYTSVHDEPFYPSIEDALNALNG